MVTTLFVQINSTGDEVLTGKQEKQHSKREKYFQAFCGVNQGTAKAGSYQNIGFCVAACVP
ncbi:MAG: hypothetical protein ITG01_10785 [Comamonas sp.]|nr:hypothetical protein [Comamonas sp.]